MLRNNVHSFPAFSELTLFDAEGRSLASTALLKPTLVLGADRPAPNRPRIAPIQIDAAQLPSTEISLHLDHAGPPVAYLVGRLSLEELWRAVDRVRVGGRGHAVLVDETGRLIAHGDPGMRASVARGEDLLWHPLIHPKAGATLAGVERYTHPGRHRDARGGAASRGARLAHHRRAARGRGVRPVDAARALPGDDRPHRPRR